MTLILNFLTWYIEISIASLFLNQFLLNLAHLFMMFERLSEKISLDLVISCEDIELLKDEKMF